MSWGNKLLIVFIAFAGLMSYMVYRCGQVPVSLVTKDYYKDELAYQKVIDGTEKANSLSKNVIIKTDSDLVVVQLPDEMKSGTVNGDLLFYCAADASKDRKLPLQTDADGKQVIRKDIFPRGQYIVKLSWASGSNSYYSEQSITIN